MIFHFVLNKIQISAFFTDVLGFWQKCWVVEGLFANKDVKKIHLQLVKEVFLYRNESSGISSWPPFKICGKLDMSKQQQRKDGEQEGLCCFWKQPEWITIHLSV